MKKYEIFFIEKTNELSDYEMGNILGGNMDGVRGDDCPCRCVIDFGGTNCGCYAASPKAAYEPCPGYSDNT